MEERRGERHNGPFLNAITFRVITPARSKVHFTQGPGNRAGYLSAASERLKGVVAR